MLRRNRRQTHPTPNSYSNSSNNAFASFKSFSVEAFGEPVVYLRQQLVGFALLMDRLSRGPFVSARS